jgi:nitrile hydratase
MNGVHDMGGMHGMGPIEYDPNEPPYREAWWGRVFALNRALGPWGRGRWRPFRYELESLPAADYLRLSYYERWFTVFVNRLLRSGYVTQAELDAGRADPGAPRPQLPPAPTVGQGTGGSSRLEDGVRPRFRAGQRVRARNINPVGHTRLPRYARGKQGTIFKDHGVWALQDTDAEGERLGGPQHVYSVRFAARELWGDQASPRDSVYIDLWEDYLERL